MDFYNFIKVLTYVQKTLGKISELCDCLSLFTMYFIMWNLFLSRSECSLCWCPCWPIAKSCMIPFFVNLSGLILVLCLRLDFYPSGLVYWYYVWELLNLAPSVSTIGSVYLFLLFVWIFDSGNCLAWNCLCESRDMLLEQCLKQCLWMVMSQIVFGFSNWFFCQ